MFKKYRIFVMDGNVVVSMYDYDDLSVATEVAKGFIKNQQGTTLSTQVWEIDSNRQPVGWIM